MTKEELYVRRQIGWDEGNDKVRVPLGTGITGAAAQQKRPIYCPDVSKDARYILSAKNDPVRAGSSPDGAGSSCRGAGLPERKPRPLRLRDHRLAGVILDSGVHGPAECPAVLAGATRASQLEAINAIAQQMTAVLDMKELLSKVCLLIQHAFQLSTCPCC